MEKKTTCPTQESSVKKSARTQATSSVKKDTILSLVEQIVERVEDSGFTTKVVDQNMGLFTTLAERVDVTPMQAMWLAIVVNMSDDHCIRAQDFSRFLGCRPIKVLGCWDDIEALVAKQFIRINAKDTDRTSLMMPGEVMTAFRKNEVYHAPSYKDIAVDQWLDRLSVIIRERDNGNMEYEEFAVAIKGLKNDNPKLQLVGRLNGYKLDEQDEMILLRTLNNFVQDNDEMITYSDISDILRDKWYARRLCRLIGRGSHALQSAGLIENVNEDGRADSSSWRLTEKAKDELLSETDMELHADPKRGLLLAENLQEKKLFFNADVTKQVERLGKLLTKEHFESVQNRLEKKGMRRGFACIFYGSPGTGKTETVYQLAKATGRNIMMVDVPNLRSKWVGDTEKNIKAVFDRYKSFVKQSSLAPILLFNEADAVLCRRNENAVSGVDKMENAMQNIILQEMENLEGIMIATTNLTDNLDGAFERRFLYKVEFPKPTPKERQYIWRAMLPELSEEDAYMLAAKYDFSGGQIENISRKQIVDSILNDEDELNMDVINEACATELLRGKQSKHIGFA